jgi:hypothetical protein
MFVMAELKTKQNDASVESFLNSVEDEQQREDSFFLLDLLKKITKEEPKMWGTSIVGFGTYAYKGKSGRSGEWFITGFSPRKQNMTVYLIAGVDHHKEALKKLGKHTTGVGCLYFRNLAAIDKKVLKDMLMVNYKKLKNARVDK